MLNGLAITRDAHSLLHLIEDYSPDIFFHLNKIILLITKEKRLPSEEERNLIQIYIEAFLYRVQEYYTIEEKYVTQERILKLEDYNFGNVS